MILQYHEFFSLFGAFQLVVIYFEKKKIYDCPNLSDFIQAQRLWSINGTLEVNNTFWTP